MSMCVQVGEASVMNVDCSRAGPGELCLEAALDSAPSSPTDSGNTSTNVKMFHLFKKNLFWNFNFNIDPGLKV